MKRTLRDLKRTLQKEGLNFLVRERSGYPDDSGLSIL